jgi:FkbM family methyltransferase
MISHVIRGKLLARPRGIARALLDARFLQKLAKKSGCTVRFRFRFVGVRRGRDEIRISRRNYVYAQDLILNFDYYFDVVEPRLERGVRVVDYSKPALHVMRADGLHFWFPELAESMETTELYLDRASIRPGDTVLDLGAYAGGATYHFARAVGAAGRVFAFEPDPRSFDCLAKNIALHHLDNVELQRRGVWSHSGRVLFQSEGNMGSAVVEAADRSSDTKQAIDVVSLSDFCAEKNLDRVDFVKMDIEGSEAPVLAGAADFIERFRPAMIIEVHRVHGVRSDAEVTSILERHGYVVEVVAQAGLPLPLLFARPADRGARA